MRLKSDKELKIGLKVPDIELLVPANNKEVAIKAIKAGADAVYIGYSRYGARIQAGNSLADLADIIDFAHIYRVKVYITLNTILKDTEINDIEKIIWKLYYLKADGIIIQDMGLIECKLPPVPVIASTQCHNNTLEKILFLEQTGFKRVILPREITLNEIKEIKKHTKIELECFIHGALCVSYSGQCYLSYANGGRSANRGECAQPCRKKYSLKDSDGKYIVRNKYLLSLKDFNLSEYIEDLIFAGVTSFKIEGRLKNAAYVVNTTAYYRQIIDKILATYGLRRSSQGYSEYNFEPDIYKTFNRGYTTFNINNSKKDLATMNYVSSLGEYIGVVKEVKKNHFSLNTNILNNGDGICFFDENNQLNGTNINKTEGNLIFPANIKGIRQGIKIYRNYNKSFNDLLSSDEIVRKISTKIKVRETDCGYIFFLYDDEGNCAIYMISNNTEEAKNPQNVLNTLKIQLAKTGKTEFEIDSADIKLKKVPFLKVSKINEIRRILTNNLRKIRRKNYKNRKKRISLETIPYPIKTLNYKANIYNKKAAEFYEKRGSSIKEYALESQKNLSGKELMVSKYCIKNQLGICSKFNNVKKYKEPFILTDESGKEYLVGFDCNKCIMSIKNRN